MNGWQNCKLNLNIPWSQNVQGKHLLNPLGKFMNVPLSHGLQPVPDCAVQSFRTTVPVQDRSMPSTSHYHQEIDWK